MPREPTFVVIDFHAESRYLLVTTLRRKFPDAEIHEIDDADVAIALVQGRQVTAVITHRTFEVEGVDLVRQLRAVDSRVPIIMVSGVDREEAALAAGATAFLHYDEWLRTGSVVEAHLPRITDRAGSDECVVA